MSTVNAVALACLVIRRHLERPRQAAVVADVKLDRNCRTAGERLQRRFEATPREDRRMNPARDLLELLDGSGEAPPGAGELCLQVSQPWRHLGLRCPHLEPY